MLSRSTGACYWPIYASDGMACHCTTNTPTASLRLKARVLKAGVMETMLYGHVTRSPTVAHLAMLLTAHH